MNSFLSQISVAPAWLWFAFCVGTFVLLLVDLNLFGNAEHKITKKAALIESGIWIALSLGFNLVFASYYGKELGLEFLTGYLVEKSLSIDNLFVILLIFNAFKVPDKHRHRVLFYGVLGAIALRAFFIIIGAKVLYLFHWVLYLFGAILVFTAVKLLRNTDDTADVKESLPIRLLKRLIPTTTTLNGNKFFIFENGVRKATPLFLALIAIELTDLIFAVDSIPAVFAVTQDAFVAFASNILAVLGLRALYFVLADWVSNLRYLKPGLAAVLGFIGTKMLIADFFKVPNWVSLLVIFSILLTASLGSWYAIKIGRKKT